VTTVFCNVVAIRDLHIGTLLSSVLLFRVEQPLRDRALEAV
jgi:hypothetical protein